MKPQTKKLLKIIIPLVIGVFFVVISIARFEAEERQLIWENIKKADLFWVSISVVLGVLSHMSRAYRWHYLLQPLHVKPRFSNTFMSLMFGYLANLGVPRSGEILRAVSLSNYEEVKFQESFGTIVTERVIDFIMLLSIVGLTIVMQAEIIFGFFEKQSINPMMTFGIMLLLIAVFLIGLKILRKSNHTFIIKIREFLEGVLKGMKSILKMKNRSAFIAHTFLIWFLYVAMFVVVKYSVPETADLGLNVMLVAFVFGSFSMSITNGGIGIYPVTVGASIALFGGSEVAGESFGWIVWVAQTLLVIVIGGISAVLLPLVNKN